MNHPVRHTAVGLLALGLLGAGFAVPTAQAEETTQTYVVATTGSDANRRTLQRLNRIGRDVTPDRTFSRVLDGFSARLTPTQVAALRDDPNVTAVQPNVRFHTTATQKLDRAGEWGLDRIDRRDRTYNQTYDYATTGAGVTVFHIDTGIQFDHQQFGGRAVSGFDFVDEEPTADDCYTGEGHGTHTAGIIGGSTYGVAKKVDLVALRVLDCSGGGELDWVLDALEWAVEHRPAGPAVINMSLGAVQIDLVDDAVERVIEAGIPVVVSAGNDGASATRTSPANAPDAITVGWATRSDRKAADSNYGKRIDLFAPGDDILSAGVSETSTSATETLSGTSMAAPMVTGAVARYLQAYPTATPAQVRAALVGESTRNRLSALGSNSPNRLLYLRRSTTGVALDVTANKSERLQKMRVRWAPPTGFGTTAVTGYAITRSGTDAAGRAFAPTVVSAETRAFAWSGLRPGVRYTVTVAPVNSFGTAAAVTVRD